MSTDPTATLTRVGDIPYYVPSGLAPFLDASRRLLFGSAPSFLNNLTPIILLVFQDASHIKYLSLSSIVDSWLAVDDVFSTDSLHHVYFLILNQRESLTLDDSIIRVLEGWKTQSVHSVSVDTPAKDDVLRGGPYFAASDGLH